MYTKSHSIFWASYLRKKKKSRKLKGRGGKSEKQREAKGKDDKSRRVGNFSFKKLRTLDDTSAKGEMRGRERWAVEVLARCCQENIKSATPAKTYLLFHISQHLTAPPARSGDAAFQVGVQKNPLPANAFSVVSFRKNATPKEIWLTFNSFKSKSCTIKYSLFLPVQPGNDSDSGR